MQNLPNITSNEVVVVGSAMLVLCVAPTVLAWGGAWRRRKALAQAAAREALAQAAAREALAQAAAREALEAAPPPAFDADMPKLVDLQELWDEPTVTLDADVFGAPLAAPATAVVETPAESPATAPMALSTPIEVLAPVEVPQPIEAPAPIAVSVPAEAPAPIAAVSAGLAEAERAPHTPAEPARFQFCLQELRRVRLPNWPPAEVLQDADRSEVWHAAERLAAERQREISATPLASPQQVQSSCLGAAEADATLMRLRFLLFPVLWPSTEEQATAEAVFEIDRAGGPIRSYVNSLRPST